jgi:multidrug resistance efflux pump
MKRWLKVAAGIAIALGGLYVIVGEQMAGVSANAMVNAQVLIVRAPIDGVLTLQVRNLGTRLDANEPLGRITDPRPDELRLTDLRQTLAQTEADLRRLEDLTSALVASRAAYVQQSADYGIGRTRQVEARLAEANASLEAAQARLREAEATSRRATELARQGIQTAADFNRARAGFEISGQEVEVARNRITYLTIEAEAARRGVFLGDSYNDAPSSQQRVRELDQRIGELSAELRERNRRVTILEAAIDEERVRAARFREASIASPAPGVLWEIMTGSGEYVRRAQDLLRLVDCSTTIVTASVRESVYNRLQVGDAVQFRLLDDGRIFEGVVARLAGSGAETIYRSLAVGPSAEHLKRFDVAVAVPALAADPELACAVGRTGRVIFAGRPLDGLRRLMSRFGLF